MGVWSRIRFNIRVSNAAYDPEDSDSKRINTQAHFAFVSKDNNAIR